MPREHHEDKGRRYLGEGRLIVRRVASETVRATCRGAGETYSVEYGRGGWRCDCPAVGRCAHIFAAMCVTDVTPQGGR